VTTNDDGHTQQNRVPWENHFVSSRYSCTTLSALNNKPT